MIVTQVPMDNEFLSNCYLVRDEKTGQCALVDPGGFTDGVKLVSETEKDNLKYILLTHGHFDHILGVPHAKKITGALIAIGKDDAACLESREKNLMDTFEVDADLYPCKADILLEDGDTVRIGESELKVMSAPGHSKGGVIFIDEDSRSIFSGDTLFYSTVGRTDTYGGDDLKLRETLKRIIALDGDYTVYPGHGPETVLSHERTRNIYIRRMSR